MSSLSGASHCFLCGHTWVIYILCCPQHETCRLRVAMASVQRVRGFLSELRPVDANEHRSVGAYKVGLMPRNAYYYCEGRLFPLAVLASLVHLICCDCTVSIAAKQAETDVDCTCFKEKEFSQHTQAVQGSVTSQTSGVFLGVRHVVPTPSS